MNRRRIWKLVCIPVVGLVFLLGLLRPWEQDAPEREKGGIVLDADAVSWEGPQAPPDQEGIRIPGYGPLLFPAGEERVSLTLYNPEENDCYFVFSLYLDEETEPLYTSDYVQPGMAIQEVTLSRGLEAGEYALYIKMETYDPETQTAGNGALVKTALTVR